MTAEDIVQAILAKNRHITEAQIHFELESERNKTAGLISDGTLLRMIAARHLTTVPAKPAVDCKLTIGNIIPGLNNIALTGRVVAIFPVKTFEGARPGKYASLMIADSEGILRVLLWNGKADLVENGILKIGQIVRFSRGYTKEDRSGNTELHISERGHVEINPGGAVESNFPGLERYTTNIKDIMFEQTVHLVGKVVNVFSPSSFTRPDNSEGRVLRFTIADDTGTVVVVAWNGKAEAIEASLKTDCGIKLVNAKVKETSNRDFEVHIDEYTYSEILKN